MAKKESKKSAAEIEKLTTVSEKSYIIKAIEYSDGNVIIERINNKFHGYELVGLLTHAKEEVLDRMKESTKKIEQ